MQVQIFQWQNSAMDHQWNPSDFSKAMAADLGTQISEPRQKLEMEVKDPIAARRVQKADREKLRRDKLNEQFLELGNTLDPDRPKNDKATILADTIQILKDLTAEVNRLKAEHSSLTEESCELTQEKNELREEKACLKADIENLTVQYQQRSMVMFPWTAIDPSGVMAPPYPYRIPLPVATGPIAMHHPSLQPYPFFGNHNPSATANPCSTFMPYSTTSSPPVEQPSTLHTSSSHTSSKRDSKCKSVDHQRGRNIDRCEGSNGVATELELKMPGSSTHEDSSAGKRKGKETQKDRSMVSGGPLSRYSSSQDIHDSSYNSEDDVSKSK